MDKLYILVGENFEWEDIVVFTDEVEAIDASIKHPDKRVEIFKRTANGFQPSYLFYVRGVLTDTFDG